jgi:hypothetical protein
MSSTLRSGEVDGEGRAIPHGGRDRVDTPALDPARRDHRLAADATGPPRSGAPISAAGPDAAPYGASSPPRTPCWQGRNGARSTPRSAKSGGPCPVRPQPPPAGPAERQNRDARVEPHRALYRVEKPRRPVPTGPAPAQPQLRPDPPQPCTQERGGLHHLGEDPPRAAGEDGLTQRLGPAIASRGPKASSIGDSQPSAAP